MVKLEMLRGSDVDFKMTWPTDTTDPLDLDGWTVSAFEAHADLTDNLTLTVGDASAGEINGVIKWDDYRSGTVMDFRVQISDGSTVKSTPVMQVEVK
jgi:hypothetical protein